MWLADFVAVRANATVGTIDARSIIRTRVERCRWWRRRCRNGTRRVDEHIEARRQTWVGGDFEKLQTDAAVDQLISYDGDLGVYELIELALCANSIATLSAGAENQLIVEPNKRLAVHQHLDHKDVAVSRQREIHLCNHDRVRARRKVADDVRCRW